MIDGKIETKMLTQPTKQKRNFLSRFLISGMD